MQVGVCALIVVILLLPSAWQVKQMAALTLAPALLIGSLLWIVNSSDAKDFR